MDQAPKAKLALASPSKADLKALIEQQREQLSKITGKYDEKKRMLEGISHDYLLELLNLRIQVDQKKKMRKFEYIEA